MRRLIKGIKHPLGLIERFIDRDCNQLSLPIKRVKQRSCRLVITRQGFLFSTIKIMLS